MTETLKAKAIPSQQPQENLFQDPLGFYIPPTGVSIDWKEYFKAFCNKHGEPVKYVKERTGPNPKPVLLFPDGYRYAIDNYAGPEWAAPEKNSEEYKGLQKAYWSIRRNMVSAELEHLRRTVMMLRQAQDARSVPLPLNVWTRDESGKVVKQRVPFDHRDYEPRMAWLENDLKDCDRKLEELACQKSATPRA